MFNRRSSDVTYVSTVFGRYFPALRDNRPGSRLFRLFEGPLGGAPMEFACDYQADFVQKIVRAGTATTVMEGKIYTDCELTRTENRMVQPGGPVVCDDHDQSPRQGRKLAAFPKEHEVR